MLNKFGGKTEISCKHICGSQNNVKVVQGNGREQETLTDHEADKENKFLRLDCSRSSN